MKLIYENEEWKSIKGFEGVYEISTYGRLKSYKNRGKPISEGHILKLTNKKGGYLSFVLSDSTKKLKRYAKIHTLVYETFVGKIPNGFQIHHKDGNKQNNHIDNLELITPSEHHKITMDLNPQMCDGMNHYNKYEKTKEIFMYDLMGNYLASFPNAVIASKITGVCRRNILQVANKDEYAEGRSRKQAGGYYWSFDKNDNKVY